MVFLAPFGWLAAVCAVGLIQTAAALKFLAGQRRRTPALPQPTPAASVIVPLKGRSSGLAEALRAFLAVDYPGALEWIFVAADPADEGLALAGELARGVSRARALASGARPGPGSEKARNLLAAVAAADPASEVFLFADADAVVRPDWARRLAAALSEPGVVLSTAVMLYRPRGGGAASWLRLAWMGFGLPWFEPMTLAAGQSLALRRKDFDALGVRVLWDAVVSEDLALAARVRACGGRCRLVMEAAPEGRQTCGWAELFSQLGRWLTLFRFYQPRVWLLGAAVVAVKLGALWQALLPPVCAPLLAAVAAWDLLYLGLVFSAVESVDAGAALLAPLLTPVLAVNYAVSAFWREIVWSGWTYHLDGPRAQKGPEAAADRRRRRLRRLAAAVLGGAAVGAAYHQGLSALIWLGFVPLFWLIEDCAASEAFGWGALFGAAAYAAGMPWLYGFLRRFLGIGPPEAAFWFSFMCGAQALGWALCAAAAAGLARGLRRAAVFAAAAVAWEGFAPSLFPTQLALSQAFHPTLVQSAETAGTAGLAWLIMGSNLALYWLWRRPGRASAAAAVLSCFLSAGNHWWGRARLSGIEELGRSRPAVRVGAAQGGRRLPSTSLSDRFSQDLPLYGELTRRAAASGAADLVVWPESTFAARLDYDLEQPAGATADGRSLSEILDGPVGGRVPLLLSAIGRGRDGGLHNVAMLVDAGRRASGFVEKTVLAPFGEYMPLGAWVPRLYRFSPLTGHLIPGAGPRLLTLPSGARVGVLICYEDFQPSCAARLAAMGASVLVAQSNDSWFDGSDLPEQHLRTAVLRAVENRRAVLRASLSGVSALIAPSGRVLERVEAGRAGALAAPLPLMDLRTDSQAGARFLYGLAAAALAAAGIAALAAKGAR